MDANLEGIPRCVRSLRYGLLLEGADDVDVKGSRTTTAPVREEDVCWARLRTRDQTGVSLEGANAADWAAEKTTSLMALWRDMRSPLPPHPTW